LGLFNKDAAGEGEGVFEEANAALDVLQATTGLQICHNDVV
jgi:hypothetical protein